MPVSGISIQIDKNSHAGFKLFDMLLNADKNPHYFDYGVFKRIEINDINIPLNLKYIGKEADF
jgi:hypothetical protein